MDPIQVVELKRSILADNDLDAERLRQELNRRHIFLINVMSAPGSGKTTLLARLLPLLQPTVRVGVLEADIDGDVDARTMAAAGALSVQVHTGGMCHLDADMTRQSLRALPAGADLVFLENIGNLVCPAEYATGAHLNIMLLSVPEGDDKPLKYPLMFGMVDAVIISKTDAEACFDFRMERVRAAMDRLNPGAKIFRVSARTGEGIAELATWLLAKRSEWEAHCHGSGD